MKYSMMGGKEKCIQDIAMKAKRKESTRKTRRRWVDKIKMDLREMGWDVVDWVDLPQDRGQWKNVVNTVMNIRIP
jgi:hypothetical protein